MAAIIRCVGALDAIELVAEFEIGRDLPRRQRHCIVGRESASDEGGDGDGDFLKRTLTDFAPSPAPPHEARQFLDEGGQSRLGMSAR